MRLTFFALLLSLFAGCQCPFDTTCKVNDPVKNEPVLGGYSKVLNQKETQIIEAVELVKSRIYKELKVNSCEFNVLNVQQQVVAGMNYKITVLAKYKNNIGVDENKKFIATVWTKLDNTKEITDFKEI